MADVLDLNAEDFVEEDDGNINIFIYYLYLTLKRRNLNWCVIYVIHFPDIAIDINTSKN
jgi:tRNA uridine 5-carbamoylmethylation protein Kti12